MRLKFSKFFLSLILIISGLLIFNSKPCKAEETNAESQTASFLDFTLNKSLADTSLVRDDSYKSSVKYSANTSVSIDCEEDMYGLYIKWYHNPQTSYTISYGDVTLTCGEDGFLHEYIPLDIATKSLNINLTEDMRICEIAVLSKGDLPDSVQVWNPTATRPDILVFSTHADDEILFLGGVLALYGSRDDVSVQVAYMCDFYKSEPYREHEELDGLWELGLNIYPVKGDFYDYYCGDYDAALQNYDYDSVCAYTTECIRRFQPLIVVTQDFNGEYGHGAHILLANAVADSVNNSNDANYHPESASEYGSYDVPKTYIHLYGENTITLNLREELETLNNRTALDALKTAYTRHVSQQGWWFYVDDEYEYSPSRFGLYRTLVGTDTGNDILENVKTYETIAYEEKVAADEAAINNANEYSNSIVESVKSFKEELTEYKTSPSISVKQLVVTLVALIIILLVIIGQAKRHKKEYDRRVLKYKKENDIK